MVLSESDVERMIMQKIPKKKIAEAHRRHDEHAEKMKLKFKDLVVLEQGSDEEEDELDEKINDILKKIDIAYSMGHEVALQQLLFHLENMKIELGTKLEKQRFELIQGKVPEQYNITDEEIDKEKKDEDD